MKAKIIKVLYAVGIFFLIFAFPLLPGLSSAKFIIIIVFLLFSLHKDFKSQVYKACKTFGSEFLYSYLLIIILTYAWPVLWQSFEWTMIGRVVSALLLYFVSFFYFQNAKKYLDIDKTIFYCFLIQSVIILFAIVSQSFYDITASFRDVNEKHVTAYGRLRGNAVAGYQFFGLVIMYAFVIVNYFLHTKKFKVNPIYIIILLFAAICSGRSVILAIAIALVFYLIKEYKKGHIKKVAIIILFSVGISIGSSVILVNNYRKMSDPLMVFVIENYFVKPIESITSDSGFESDSTDELEEMGRSNEIKKYFILGSGRFVNEDGSYFGHVDIGYYRILGYYGYIGGVVAFLLVIFLLFFSKTNLDLITRIAFFVLIILYNVKGEVAVWSNNIIPILVGFLFFSNTCNQKTSYLKTQIH